MAVAVQQPQRRESDLDTILKGLQVVGGIFDIKNQMARAEQLKQEQDMQQEKFGMQKSEYERNLAKEERLARSELTPMEMLQAGLVDAPPGISGGITIREARAPGEIGPSAGLARTMIPRSELQSMRAAQAKAKEAKIAEIDRINNAVKDANAEFEKKPQTKDSTDAFARAKLVDDLLDEGTAQSDEIALRQLFRMSGDVGAIRDADIQALGSDPSIYQKFKSQFGRLAEGEVLTPEARKAVKDGLKVMQAHHARKLENSARSFANKQASSTRGVNADDIFRGMEIGDLLQSELNLVREREFRREGLSQERFNVGVPGEATANPAQPTREDQLLLRRQQLMQQRGR